MFHRIREDVRTARDKDPAARSTAAVVLTYAGLHAVWLHRIAHALWTREHHLSARLLSHLARFLTGIEIHPAADVGHRLFIDHGMGVVIGETADVGDDVHMHHGVTLGGNDPRPVERHPTVEDDVIIGANASIVGDITVGEGARVGAGAVVTRDVAPGSTMVGVPAHPLGESDATAEPDDADEEVTPADAGVPDEAPDTADDCDGSVYGSGFANLDESEIEAARAGGD